MSGPFHIVVCGSLVPDPLQTLEPVTGPTGPGLKNEMMLPSVLDPWAGHALFEAAHLARNAPGSKVWLVSLGPKARLQQLKIKPLIICQPQVPSYAAVLSALAPPRRRPVCDEEWSDASIFQSAGRFLHV